MPTVAVIVESLTTMYPDALVPPKYTAVAFVKLLPLMVTVLPVAAESGEKEFNIGEGK